MLELYTALPRPPANIDAALSWVEGGEIVEPGVLAFEATLTDEIKGVATVAGSDAAAVSDVVLPNSAGGAELRAVAKSFRHYLANNSGEDSPQAALSKRKRWLQRAYGQEQLEISQAMTPCATPCTDKAIYDANIPYLRQRQSILKLEIRSWNALFDDWRKTRRREIVAADTALQAIAADGVGEKGRALMAQYRGAILKEIELMLSITKLCALRVEAIMKGLDGSEPDAISGATKKAG